MMELITTVILMAASGGLGYYVGARGMEGVKIDLDNTKNELEKVKTLVSSKTPKTITITAPKGDSKSPDTVTVTASPSK